MSEAGFKNYPDNPIIPVINVQSESQAVEMAGLALQEGAGGVFLIDHKARTYSDPDILAETAGEVMVAHPELWVGVNCLAGDAIANFELFGGDLNIDGLWSNNPLNWSAHTRVCRSNLEGIDAYGLSLNDCRKKGPLFFGGLAMKGDGYIEDPFEAAAFVDYAQKYVDVVTISGPETGQASPIERVRQIRLAVEEGGKLAVASGVSVENVASNLVYADYLLVGSSIETEPRSGTLDPVKLRRLMHVYQDFRDKEISLAILPIN